MVRQWHQLVCTNETIVGRLVMMWLLELQSPLGRCATTMWLSSLMEVSVDSAGAVLLELTEFGMVVRKSRKELEILDWLLRKCKPCNPMHDGAALWIYMRKKEMHNPFSWFLCNSREQRNAKTWQQCNQSWSFSMLFCFATMISFTTRRCWWKNCLLLPRARTDMPTLIWICRPKVRPRIRPVSSKNAEVYRH
jgi:hypothetical protein